MMLARLANKFRFSGFYTVLEAAAKYKNSKTQSKMHEFDQHDNLIQDARKNIDYSLINKQSEGCVLIREFLFQQQKPAYQINFPEKYITPSGKWNVQEMQKLLQIQPTGNDTPAQQENKLLLSQFEQALKQKFNKYYENIGKRNYTLSVKEQVQKIEQMTPEQFEKFMIKLNN